jgi:uncharacterized protein
MRAMPTAPLAPRVAPLTDAERERLQALLDALPPPCVPPDLSALDGFLVGVLLQPQPVTPSRWLPWVHDFDEGRPAPPSSDLAPLHALVRRRHAELGAAIAARRWFDPWVFELEAADEASPCAPRDMVLPWVAGWAAALDRFPALLAHAGDDAREPLATLYAQFDADDLEEVDDLAELIDQVEPPETMAEAVEDLVRCTLLLADAMHLPRSAAPRARRSR